MELHILEDFKDFYNKKNPKIIKYPSDTLRKVSDPVNIEKDKIAEIINKMIKYLDETQAVGISAPQVGINKRIVLIKRTDDSSFLELINPEVIDSSGEIDGVEGCLSFPGLYGVVTRAKKITVKYLNASGEESILELDNFDAIITQHEIDHLDGVLFIDKVNEFSLRWILPPYKVI